ncbi:MAG: serine/threonine protein kinase [Ignavibacteriales bacterium]|nr:serine/threonine protein kinase [Ignavibacteriales bacterium]
MLKTFSRSGEKGSVERFKRESQLLLSIDHKSVIKLVEYGENETELYLALEYFHGSHLGKFAGSDIFSIEDKLKITESIISGVLYLHEQGIIHRDLKPENILVGPELQVKIVDFGLSSSQSSERITRKNEILGTPAYLPPEYLTGNEHSAKGDLFSLGMIIYELFVGINPIKGDNLTETLSKISSFSIQDLNLDSLHLPESIRLILLKTLNEDPEKRFLSLPFSLVKNRPITGDVTTLKGALKGPNPSQRSDNRQDSRLAWYRFFTVVPLILIVLIYYFFQSGFSGVDGTEQLSNISGNEKSPTTAIDLKENGVELKKSDSEEGNKPEDSGKKDEAEKVNKTTLEEDPANDVSGYLGIKCYPWGEVYLDGKYYDTTPLKGDIKIKPGVYQLKVSNPAFPPFAKEIVIKGGTTVSEVINFKKEPGYLTINVFPWGEVKINNVSYGVTPISAPISLPEGKHIITLLNPDFGTYSESITIVAGKTTQYKHKFDQAINAGN